MLSAEVQIWSSKVPVSFYDEHFDIKGWKLGA